MSNELISITFSTDFELEAVYKFIFNYCGF